MNEFKIFQLVLPVLVPVFVGWLAVRAKLLSTSDARPLTSAYLYIFLPALIVEHLASQNLSTLFDVKFILATLSLILGIYGTVLIFHKLVLRRTLASSALAAFASSKFNAVIIGLPLLLIAIGRQAIIATVINLILGYFTILPLTLFLLEFAKTEGTGQATKISAVVRRALQHTLLDPLVLATIAGLLMAGLKVALPRWLVQSLITLGDAAVPVPLVAVGMTISSASFREDIGEVSWISLVRMVASPLLAIEVARWFTLTPLYSVALVISFGLPTAKMAFALAEHYDEYERPMAAIVTITTLSMALLYPIFVWICEHLWPGVIQRVR
jgi:malonate transporter